MTTGKVRNFTLLTKRDDLTLEQFRDHWRAVHAPIAAELPGLLSYTQHHVTDTGERATFPAPERMVDGIVEMTFESREAMDAALSGSVGLALVEDAANFMSQMRMYVVEDFVIVEDRMLAL
ncbi:EthD domain-containing protein [Arthrobacter sp. TB 26]|uniref:EthD domain-containing protein n=1 Tax=Arthrobacter sp. TB 26 TaxID=494420 RepID=UPI00041B4ADE|nr:EthD domain-containing protein [Arthrobacter sp. TB 26]